MARPKSSFPTHEFKVLTAEESFEACYPIASTTDTTSVYFQESNAETEGSYLNENDNLTSRSTPRNQGIELMPTNLRYRKRGIKIGTLSTPLLPSDTRMGSLKSPKRSRAPDILRTDSPSASPGQKLARLRTKEKKGKVKVQTISLSSSPSPSSPPPGTPLIPYPPPNTPVFAVGPDQQTKPSFTSTPFPFDGNGNVQMTKVRLQERFSTEEFVDQLLDRKTVDWQCVKDETTQKYLLEFSKTT